MTITESGIDSNNGSSNESDFESGTNININIGSDNNHDSDSYDGHEMLLAIANYIDCGNENYWLKAGMIFKLLLRIK